jgi:flagellar biosynthetic protein FlhB
MSGGDDGDKTEDPTERKRSEAREKGNVAKSIELVTALMMLTSSLCFLMMGPEMFQNISGLMKRGLSSEPMYTLDPNVVNTMMTQSARSLMEIILPFMLTMFAVAIIANVMQVGLMLNTDALEMKLEHIDPMKGFQRIFSIASVVKLAVSLGKLTALSMIVCWFIYAHLGEWSNLSSSEPSTAFFYICWKFFLLAIYLALALLTIALLDFTFQFWKHEQDLKMSKQEVRDEMKNMEGDPHIRARRREAHRKLAQAKEMNGVKTADVLITNPTHISVALKYDPRRFPAPIVVAKGQEDIALQMRKIAKAHGVPIIERKPLARQLYAEVKVGRPIPPDMYNVFVEIMAYVYRLTGKKPPELVETKK